MLNEATRSFGSTQLNFPKSVARMFRLFARRHGVPPDPHEVHCTVQYGISSDTPPKHFCKGFGPITLKLGKTFTFPPHPEKGLTPLCCHVEGGDRLLELRSHVRLAFPGEVTDTHPKYTPHACISYLPKGFVPELPLVGLDFFEGMTCTINELQFSDREERVTMYPLGLHESVSNKVRVFLREAI